MEYALNSEWMFSAGSVGVTYPEKGYCVQARDRQMIYFNLLYLKIIMYIYDMRTLSFFNK